MKKFYRLNDFSGGLVDARDSRDIADNENQIFENIFMTEKGVLWGGINGGSVALSPAGTTARPCPGAGIYLFESDYQIGTSSADNVGDYGICFSNLASGFGRVNIRSFRGAGVTGGSIDLGTTTTYSSTLTTTTTRITDANSNLLSIGFKIGDRIMLDSYQYIITGITESYIDVTQNDYAPLTANATPTSKTIYLLTKPVYYSVDNALRVADGSVSAPLQPKWYGYVKRTHFNGLNPGGVADTYDDWYENDNTLSAPTELVIDSGTGRITAGNGWAIDIQQNATGGAWEGKTYQVATSFIYDGNQESLLYVPGSATYTFTPSSGDALDMAIRCVSPFDERVTGGRIYYRKDGSEEEWSLLADINLRDGVRGSMHREYAAWSATSGVYVTSGTFNTLSPSADSYETLNGFSSNEKAIDVGAVGEGYRTAVIANRRCFIANVKTRNDDGETVHYRDRIMYSPVNKFDTFPRSYFIDVIKGDNDEWVRLLAYGDRLFAFKSKTLYIINIASPSPSGWFLEDSLSGHGISNEHSAENTQIGIIWANFNGVYWYDGNQTHSLIDDKFSKTTWGDYATESMVVGYDPSYENIVVIRNSHANPTSGEVYSYYYNLRSRSWGKFTKNYFLYPMTGSAEYNTNFIEIPLTNYHVSVLYCSTPSGSSWIGYTFEDMALIQPGSNAIVKWKSKDIDFGEPEKIKKVYGAKVTYEYEDSGVTSGTLTTPFAYSLDGSSAVSASFTGNMTPSGGEKDVLDLTLSTPVECQSLAVYFEAGNGATDDIKIHDIQIEYRTLRKRVT